MEAMRPNLADRKRSFVKEAILDAAEQLMLENDPADFSMRTLCDKAEVSFSTPFNYFGTKNGILRGLAMRVFERVDERFAERAPPGDAIDRVIAMGDIGVEVWLERSAIHRSIAASLMSSGEAQSDHGFYRPSCELWCTALGNFDGFEKAMIPLAKTALPEQLATMFRGTIALWIAGELPDNRFAQTVRQGLALLLLGVAPRKRRDMLIRFLQGDK
jgi:AcrR family transcriptional regulator